jgi:hypothetical protein
VQPGQYGEKIMDLHSSSFAGASVIWLRRLAFSVLAVVTMMLGTAATAPKAEAGVSVSIGYGGGYGYGYRPYYVAPRHYYRPRYVAPRHYYRPRYVAPVRYYAPRQRYVCRTVQVGTRYSFSRGYYVPAYAQRCFWR